MKALRHYLLLECKRYREEIRPLRDPADIGEGPYEPFDEAYNEWLESLHGVLEQHFIEVGLLEAT